MREWASFADEAPSAGGGGSAASDGMAAEWEAMLGAGAEAGPGTDDEEALMREWAAMASGDEDAAEDGDGMAAEWEAMLGAGAEEDDGCDCGCASTRVLNQDEIDSLLGFNDACEGERSGIQAILNSALVSYERLPMLEVAYDRFVRSLSTTMRATTSDNVEVSLDNILSLRFGDYLNSIPLPAMLAVFRAREWDGHGVMVFDSSLIYSMVDVLLGGRRGTAAMRIEGRSYSNVERALLEMVANEILADLSAAFAPIANVSFDLERIETNPRFSTVARPSAAAVVAKLRIDMEDRGGRMEVLLPYATLEPVRDKLLQMFMGEKLGHDRIWEAHLADELREAEVGIDARLGEVSLPLARVLSLAVGDTVVFGPVGAPVDLACGGRPVGTATLAEPSSKHANLACRIETISLNRKD
jgi:flagellar motor switch protein FliM